MINAKGKEGGAALDRDSPIPSNLHFRITGKTDFLSPTFRTVPQQLICAVGEFALSRDLYTRLLLERRQLEDVRVGDSLFNFLDCFLLFSSIVGSQ